MRKLTAKILWRIKREATRNSLNSIATIFRNFKLPGVSRGTRCQVLRDIEDWRLKNDHHFDPGAKKVEKDVKDELVGPYWVEDWLKINSKSYCRVLEDTFFKQQYRNSGALWTLVIQPWVHPSGPSRVTLISSVHKNGFRYFLDTFWRFHFRVLFSGGGVSAFFTVAMSHEHLTSCTSGDSRKVAVPEYGCNGV